MRSGGRSAAVAATSVATASVATMAAVAAASVACRQGRRREREQHGGGTSQHRITSQWPHSVPPTSTTRCTRSASRRDRTDAGPIRRPALDAIAGVPGRHFRPGPPLIPRSTNTVFEGLDVRRQRRRSRPQEDHGLPRGCQRSHRVTARPGWRRRPLPTGPGARIRDEPRRSTRSPPVRRVSGVTIEHHYRGGPEQLTELGFYTLAGHQRDPAGPGRRVPRRRGARPGHRVRLGAVQLQGCRDALRRGRGGAPSARHRDRGHQPQHPPSRW